MRVMTKPIEKITNREIDARVAIEIMGLIPNSVGGYSPHANGITLDVNLELPRYSTDIGAAWTVFDRLTEPHIYRNRDGEWCTACTAKNPQPYDGYKLMTVKADTASMAICLAALNACRAALAAVKEESK